MGNFFTRLVVWCFVFVAGIFFYEELAEGWNKSELRADLGLPPAPESLDGWTDDEVVESVRDLQNLDREEVVAQALQKKTALIERAKLLKAQAVDIQKKIINKKDESVEKVQKLNESLTKIQNSMKQIREGFEAIGVEKREIEEVFGGDDEQL